MKSLLFIIAGLSASCYYSDISSEHALFGVIAPLGIFVFLMSLSVWLVVRAGFGAKTNDRGTGGGFGDGDGGG